MPTLNWFNRDETLKVAKEVQIRLLEADDTLSYGEKNENMIIQGDNLDALKALLPYYKGQVKCIYIDPPYNTRSAFDHYDDNLEHTQWLHMMYPRLELLREFLREDGCMWVSVDDNESHYLKIVLDEIFQRKNFLTTFIWKKAYGGGAKSKWFVGLHEYVHCYAKNIGAFPEMFLEPDPTAESRYYRLSDEKKEIRGPFRIKPLEATKSMDHRENLIYPIPAPDGTEIWPKRQWWWAKERTYAAIENNDLYFAKGKDGAWSVQYKQYLKDESGNERKRKPMSIFEGPYTQDGTKETLALFGMEDKFAFPKPEGLIKTIIESCSNKGDLVMDSFLGSGTTVAVAHKMGRRYIGIEMGDHAVTHVVPRMKKVVEGEQGGISKAVNWEGGGGFRFYRLGEPVFDENGLINHDVSFKALAAHVWLASTKTPYLGAADSPLLGVHEGTAYYLLYNGILGDKKPASGNVLTSKVLKELPPHDGNKVIFGEACRLGAIKLDQENIVFKQIPYEINAK